MCPSSRTHPGAESGRPGASGRREWTSRCLLVWRKFPPSFIKNGSRRRERTSRCLLAWRKCPPSFIKNGSRRRERTSRCLRAWSAVVHQERITAQRVDVPVLPKEDRLAAQATRYAAVEIAEEDACVDTVTIPELDRERGEEERLAAEATPRAAAPEESCKGSGGRQESPPQLPNRRALWSRSAPQNSIVRVRNKKPRLPRPLLKRPRQR